MATDNTTTETPMSPAAANILSRTAAQELAAVRDNLFNVERKIRAGNGDAITEKLVDGLVALTQQVSTSLETVTATLARVIDASVPAITVGDANVNGGAHAKEKNGDKEAGGKAEPVKDPNTDEYGRPIFDKKGKKIAYVGKSNTRWL